MYTFIGIENITMNALIEVNERQHQEEVAFSELLRYARKVAKIFEANTGREAAMLVSKKYQVSMMEEYSDLLDIDAYEERGVFRLRKGASMEEIVECFRWTIDRDLMNALMSEEAVQELETV